MDALKLLGSLMKTKSLASGLGGSLLGGLLGGKKEQQPSGGGLGSIMGLLGGGGGGGGGAISGLLGSIMGGGGQEAAPQQTQTAAPQESQDQAVLMIRAMVNAAKSDGRLDDAEQQNIISKLGGDLSQAETDFLKQEFQAPIDVASFAKSVPQGLEQQIYAISLTSIELDTQNEAQYLAQLGQALNLQPQALNQIHEQLGAPVIFS